MLFINWSVYCALLQCQWILLPTWTMSVGVGRIFEYVCLSVCLFVRSITQKWMIPKCSNLVYGMTLGYYSVICFWVWKVSGHGHRVSKSILCTKTIIHWHSLGGVTSSQCGIKLCECLPIISSVSQNMSTLWPRKCRHTEVLWIRTVWVPSSFS